VILPTGGRVARNLNTLGILWMVVGGLWLIPSIVLLLLGTVVHLAIPGSETVARALGPLVLVVLGGALTLVASACFLAGWGLKQKQPWARILALVLGVVSLLHPPFGTALGIYTLYVLLPSHAGDEYARIAQPA
jgi:hypothetical protein